MEKPKNNAPEFIQLYPTFRCNYSCSFCFNKELPRKEDISPEKFEKLALLCRSLGIAHIDMLGGEPTLHPDIGKLAAILCRTGLKTTISTNGSRPDVLFYLSENFPPDTVRIGVSLNQARIQQRLHEYILLHRPIVKSVFTGNNEAAEVMHRYLETGEIDCRLIFMDAAEPRDLENCPSFESYSYHLEDLEKNYPQISGVFCTGFTAGMNSGAGTEDIRCPAGTAKLSVMPDGSVYPCYLFFRYRQFRLGNLLEDDFSRIWHHPVLDFFRRFDGSPCTRDSCRFSAVCRGGCPAMSYLASGRLDLGDPRCGLGQ